MAQDAIYDILVQVLQEIVTDLVTILPKILIAVVIIAIVILIIRFLNIGLSKALDLVKLDELFHRLIKIELPFSLQSLLVGLVDLGIVLIALFGIASLFLGPEHLDLMREILGYGARIVSVVLITILTFVLFTALIDRMTIETRMRGYVVFIVLIITTMMVIDLTNLSDPTKTALENGLSVGLGLSIGVFAVWFFFHELFDKLLGQRAPPRGDVTEDSEKGRRSRPSRSLD